MIKIKRGGTMLEIGLLLFGLLGLGLIWFRKPKFETPQTRALESGQEFAYRAAPSIFVNRAEQAFFDIMKRALPPGFILLTKVRMEDIVGVKPDISDPKRKWALRGRIKSRHVDFLICNPVGVPALVVELDGASHRGRGSAAADNLKDRIFAACGVPCVRVKTGEDFARKAHIFAKSLVRPAKSA